MAKYISNGFTIGENHFPVGQEVLESDIKNGMSIDSLIAIGYLSPAADAPAADTPAADAPAADTPAADAPAADTPAADSQTADAPVADAPVADDADQQLNKAQCIEALIGFGYNVADIGGKRLVELREMVAEEKGKTK